MMTTNEIRKAFLDFFASKQHHIVPSAPMVVKNDPTLMFTNAGMNPFKDIFLGNNPAQYPRVADTQKCLRVSGKHNDLEEVGRDTYHHTMFEMLGNWSFGDYFKKEAIAWAWEFLTDVLKIDRSRLYATVFEGSEAEHLAMDTEAYDIWKQYMPEKHILKGNKHDNFWEMGDTGPCGPCSEIHYDSRPEEERKALDGSELVNKDHPQVIEIWNLVFMQYNRKASGELELLPARHVDTGMGFERLCRVLQNKTSNYDIDLFQRLIAAVGNLCGKQYGQKEDTDVAMRVVADHIRAISFAIADGQIPSNNKAGYVIRRLLRRAVRYGYTFLGLDQPFLHALVPALADIMGDAYPELHAQQEFIQRVVREEEASFLRTLSTGMSLIEGIIEDNRKAGRTEVPGEIVFELYDTYGFPLDLTELILRERQMTYDTAAYQAALAAQKARSRAAAAVEKSDWVELMSLSSSHFVGYDTLETDARIARYRKTTTKGRDQYQVVLDETPFYGESGGQTGDTGFLEKDGVRYPVLDTKKENNLIIHILNTLPEDPDGVFHASVDAERRQQIACNHSATHLLDRALREVLGTHVEQKGSLVTDHSLRFDFSHFQKVTDEELRQVERLVNAYIRDDAPRQEYRDISVEEARAAGAIALFSEKYGDKVRMIQFGASRELCGGTHVKATGNIGFFKIVSECAVAAGIRRIEAVTGPNAEKLLYGLLDTLKGVSQLFNNSPSLLQAVEKTISENESLHKEVTAFMQEKTARLVEILRKDAVKLPNGIRLIRTQSDATPEMIRNIAFALRNSEDRLAMVAGSVCGGKPSLSVMLGDDLVAEGLSAAGIVREAGKAMQGGGGGQPHFAVAGGKMPEKLEDAMQIAVDMLSK
ncbi:MAG: alanine--tRNA ligase [Bacteroidales bacterium]|nr:alanine--tRNA ligase [Bacteroidales bacterium]